jgi:hypothetical protein
MPRARNTAVRIAAPAHPWRAGGYGAVMDIETIAQMLVPGERACGPLSASASTNGRVALFSAKVQVRGTAPGMLVIQ